MLLAIDVGNTNTVLGVFDGTQLRAHWRLTTRREQTADEYGLFIEALLRSTEDQQRESHRADLERIALVAFLRRLLDRHAESQDHMWAETLLPKASDDELERLVEVALSVVAEEAKG